MKIIIAGAGEVGSHLAKMLSNESNEITVIDNDPQRLRSLSEYTDIISVEGKSSSIEVIDLTSFSFAIQGSVQAAPRPTFHIRKYITIKLL